MSEQPFDSQNAAYAQLLYEEWARNPRSVPETWRRFFDRGPAVTRAAGLLLPEGLSVNGEQGAALAPSAPAAAPAREPAAGDVRRLLPKVARATSFVQAFRDHGHMLARVDPLGSEPPGHPQLDPSFFGTSMEELQELPAEVVMGPEARDETVADALLRLRSVYAGHIGYEFEHLEDPGRVRWLWDQVESEIHTQPLGEGDEVLLLQRLSEVEGFEQFLHRAFLGQKRFSIEGNDMLVPMLDLALEEAGAAGGREVVLGMAHRGRLNVLAHIVGIGYCDILREFEGVSPTGALEVPGTGDVKYHHGAEGDHALPDGGSIRVTLAPNPSHLEFVGPVVLGMTRALQHGGAGRQATQDTAAVVPILIHGDAAFAAEGVVAETLNLGRIGGYSVGGTIHVIVNNQIGFTTMPSEGRSTRYASDLAKGYDFPIIHVNADHPEACLAAVRLAMAYRAEYHDDVVIDLIGYRRHGHNEGDEPAFTQPRLYELIDGHATVRTLWMRRLVEDGVIPEEDAEAFQDAVARTLREAQDDVQKEAERAGAGADEGDAEATAGAATAAGEGDDAPRTVTAEDAGNAEDAGSAGDAEDAGNAEDVARAATEAGGEVGVEGDAEGTAGQTDAGGPAGDGSDDADSGDGSVGTTGDGATAVGLDRLVELNEAALAWPDGFVVHPKLRRSLDRRREDFGEDTRIEWAHAEMLAFASLLDDGYVLRLTGQDAQRGTFSQRHLVLHDVETGEEHTPLGQIGDGRFEIYNSPLTEAACLGYEYGYSVAAGRDLVLWEAQFGDFVNAAQVAIDQFVSSGREKWHQCANLTLLLPHGYEGQGPEHSSARLERFLQLCAEENMRVVYPTTPAQYFHLLRRQARTLPEKPLIVMTPKSLLRLPAAASEVRELAEGGFRPVIDDPTVGDRRNRVRRLVLCTGKVYYDLQGSDRRDEAGEVAIGRVEELYPFPTGAVRELVDGYPGLEEVVWTQEEPRNMGALTFVGPRLRPVVPREFPLRYVARPERASPAEGKAVDHRKEQARIVREALGVDGG